MTNLSPKAQAVKDAAWASFWSDEAMAPNDAEIIAAAVLAAAADQVVPEQFEPSAGDGEPWPRDYQLMSDSKWEQRQHTRAELLAIAAELKGQP